MTSSTSTGPFVVACVQMTSGRSMDANLEVASQMVGEAASKKATLVCLPENFSLMNQGTTPPSPAYDALTHPAIACLSALAKKHGIWVLGGSVPVAHGKGGDARLRNRSVLLSPKGDLVAKYDKIHLFDAVISEHEVYRESARYAPGQQAVLARTDFGNLGLSVCYDVRFPHLYRVLARAGAEFLSVPAAFTRVTGQAHWHVLLRARAIETGCFVFAPAQCGNHEDGRQTFGHSLIVAPWGEVLADGGEEPSIILAKINPDEILAARKRLPCLENDALFSLDIEGKG